jgi:hypothetical protein
MNPLHKKAGSRSTAHVDALACVRAVNSITDYNTAAVLQTTSRHSRGRSRSRSFDWRSQRRVKRRHSADFSRKQRMLAGLGRQSLDVSARDLPMLTFR